MTAPTPVSQTATAWNTATSPKTTASISVQAGDILVAFGITANGATTIASCTDSGSNTWTRKQTISFGSSQAYLTVFTATANATASITVTLTSAGGTADFWGGMVHVWRSGTLGTTAQNNNGSATGAPSITLTTGAANSAISAAVGDWTASTATAAWTITAGTPVKTSDYADGSQYGAHTAYYGDVGAAGSKTIGMSAPSGQTYGIIAVEIQGTAGGGAATGTLAAVESGSDAASFSGSVKATGTLAATETGRDTASFSGSVKASGALAATETGSDTASFVGTFAAVGVLSATETGNDTASFSGSYSIPGAAGVLAAIEAGQDAASFTGQVTFPDVTGALAAIETGQDFASFALVAPVYVVPLPIGPLKGGPASRSIVGRSPPSTLRRI